MRGDRGRALRATLAAVPVLTWFTGLVKARLALPSA